MAPSPTFPTLFIGDDRPSFCRPPQFHLNYQNGIVPELIMSSVSYRVIHLNSEAHTLNLARLDLWNETCTDVYINSTFDGPIFSYVPEYPEQGIQPMLDVSNRRTTVIRKNLQNTLSIQYPSRPHSAREGKLTATNNLERKKKKGARHDNKGHLAIILSELRSVVNISSKPIALSSTAGNKMMMRMVHLPVKAPQGSENSILLKALECLLE
ncbi:hypothetical protein JHK85_019191 [Glycine max]|nr:hypothetical protein JHK85_019191 [Glycine max]